MKLIDVKSNVTQLTNDSQNVVANYTYDAFGNTVTSGAGAGLNAYRFSTKEQIGGLYYYGYRFYSPGLGKWINRDPIQEAGGINVYGFVGNNGINAYDDYGLELAMAAGGLLAGGIFGAISGAGGGKNGIIAGAVGGAIGGAITGLIDIPWVGGAIGAAITQALLEILNAKCPISFGMVVRVLVAAAIGGAMGALYGGLEHDNTFDRKIAVQVANVTSNVLINLWDTIASAWDSQSAFAAGACPISSRPQAAGGTA